MTATERVTPRILRPKGHKIQAERQSKIVVTPRIVWEKKSQTIQATTALAPSTPRIVWEKKSQTIQAERQSKIVVTGSGVLPLAVHRDQIYVLLGRENNDHDSNDTWCGFGGGLESGSIVENAVREFMEESMAIIMSREDITAILTHNQGGRLLTRYQLDRPDTNRTYVEHVVLIPYDPKLPCLFDRIYRQFNRCATIIHRSCKVGQCNITGVDIGKTCSPLFEKDRMAWFKLEDVLSLAQLQTSGIIGDIKLRPCFAEMTLAAQDLIYKSIR